MKLKKLTVVLLAAVMLLSLFLAACGNGNDEPSGTSNQPPSDASKDDPKDPEVDKVVDPNLNLTGLPVVKEEITIKVAGSSRSSTPNEEMTSFIKLKEDTNVNVNWDIVPENGWQEKKNLLIASGNFPDALLDLGKAGGAPSNSEIIKYGAQGIIIPLEDLIEKYAPNLKAQLENFPEMKARITTPDGHIYTLPKGRYSEGELIRNFIHINKTWLDQLGLPVPTTTEEFKEALIAFRDNDMNGNGKTDDEIPFTYLYEEETTNFGLYGLYGSFGMPDNEEHIVVKDGKAIYTAVQPEWKAATKFMNSLYKEKLVDPEAITQLKGQLVGKGKEKEMILGAFSGFSPQAVAGPKRIDDYVAIIPPLEGPQGHKMWAENPLYFEIGAFAITSANKYPEATMRWIDQAYDPVRGHELNKGTWDIVWGVNEEGQYVRLKENMPEGMNNGEFQALHAPQHEFPFFILKDEAAKTWQNPNPAYDRIKYVNEMLNYTGEYMYFPDVLFAEEDSRALSQYMTDIQTFVNQKQAHWMSNGGIDEEWDSYIDRLNKVGLEDMMRIYQERLDLYNAQ